jgi:two-component system LytT family sensor kinase
LIFLIFGRRKKEIFEIERRKKLQIDLQIIKSQLNPHFIFNCLNSIQGLVNNNNNIKANTYLSTFAKLLKNTLIYSTETTVPLETELQSIELYLKMEQLRFNFSAQITLDKQINATEVDIPTFLIQPIIENSVKHGIADKGILGKIEIEISIDGKDLTINIKDNGKGYNLNTEYSGYGLKLTNKRIDLLNALNKQKEIMLDIQSSNANGTESKLTFKDWIDEY